MIDPKLKALVENGAYKVQDKLGNEYPFDLALQEVIGEIEEKNPDLPAKDLDIIEADIVDAVNEMQPDPAYYQDLY